jgi:transcriptional regulator with XRE-family HTH domain
MLCFFAENGRPQRLKGSTMESFAQLIAHRRRELDLTLRDISEHIKKSDGQSISLQYADDLEKGRRIPTPEMLPQLAGVLQLSTDLLYFMLGLLPPDVQEMASTPEQILSALQAFRASLTSLKEEQGNAKTMPVLYTRVSTPTYPLSVIRDGRSGLLERHVEQVE